MSVPIGCRRPIRMIEPRALRMGDGDVVAVPIEGLLHPKYITSRSGRINPEKRQPTITAGNPLTFSTSQENHILKIQESPQQLEEGMNTTHFTIIDRTGNIGGQPFVLTTWNSDEVVDEALNVVKWWLNAETQIEAVKNGGRDTSNQPTATSILRKLSVENGRRSVVVS